MGPYVVQVDGDHAVATGYATVYVREDPADQAVATSVRAVRARTPRRYVADLEAHVPRGGSPDRSDVLGPTAT